MGKKSQLLVCASAFILCQPQFVLADKTKSDGILDEVVTIGSRREARVATESLVAVDILNPDEINSTGYTDVNDALRTLVPSFNVKRLPLNDGASFVRPVTLRSSPSDHVLLLMNGKRRHRSATVQVGTGHATTSGSQGQDFNMLPVIAFKNIEVLRDGAAAQYGSDAIAGVINMSMKNANQGGEILGHIGEYFEGDGDTADIQVNIGLPVTDNGFLNLSAQYVTQDITVRNGGTHVGAQALIDMGVPNVPQPAINLGQPDYEAVKTAWNAGLQLNDEMEAYFFGNFAKTESTVGFFYRQSVAAGGLGSHATFADSCLDNVITCAGHPMAGLVNPDHTQIFDLTTTYPGGFTPQFTGDQSDFSNVIGVRANRQHGLNWDMAFRWGRNEVEYTIGQTINPSFGVASPTRFKPGSLAQREYQLDIETAYDMETTLFYSPLTVFGGFSYRDESYEIGAGDLASYAAGPLIDLPVGSNGFQGFDPNTAGENSTDSYAVFMEFETDIIDNWTAALAGRYEDYQAFGDNFSYKFATRFAFNNAVALRGAVNTGFRAPAGGQQFGTSQTSQIDATTGDFILDAVLVPGSPAAQIFGSQNLEPETSFSVSAGIVITTDMGLDLTLDFYQIEVDDRLLLSDSISTTLAQKNALAAVNFPNGEFVESVRFFQNRLDTKVSGVDLVTTYVFDWEGGSSTDINLALNYNKQELRSNATDIFSASKIIEFEQGIPRSNGNLGIIHHIGDFDITVRGIYYGSWKRRGVAADPGLSRDAEILVDALFNYRINDTFEVHFGGRNIFDEDPPEREAFIFSRFGLLTDNHSVFNLSGGYYYLGTKYKF